MGILSIFLFVIFSMASLIMILVILLQEDEGEGIALFGGASTTPFGSRSGNVLTRFTAILAALFLAVAFILAWLNRTPESADLLEKARLERLRTEEAKEWWVEAVEPKEAAPQETPPQEEVSPPSEAP